MATTINRATGSNEIIIRTLSGVPERRVWIKSSYLTATRKALYYYGDRGEFRTAVGFFFVGGRSLRGPSPLLPGGPVSATLRHEHAPFHRRP